MNKITFLTVAGLMAMPSAALAQNALSFSGTATLGYTHSDVNGLPGVNADLSTFSLDAESDLAIGQNWNIGFDLGYSAADGDIAGAPFGVDVDLIDFGIEPSYRIDNGAYVGVYYQHNDFNITSAALPAGVGLNTESWGVFGGYEGNLLWVEGFVGNSDLNQTLFINSDADDFGLSAAYAITPRAEVFGNILYSNLNLGGANVGITTVSGGAEYEVIEGLAGYGSLGVFEIDTGPLGRFDGFGMTLGVSYDLASRLNVPVKLNAEYSNTDIDLSGVLGSSPSVERFSFGVTVALNGGSGDILNSGTRTARGGYRSVVTAIANQF